jgi:hypothetical protein
MAPRATCEAETLNIQRTADNIVQVLASDRLSYDQASIYGTCAPTARPAAWQGR